MVGEGMGRPPRGGPGGPGMARGAMGRPAGVGLSSFRSPAAIKRTFASLGETSYRNLWIGALLQMGSMQMQMMARGYLVYEITGSGALLGAVTAAAAVPMLFFGLFGGVLADRVDKKRIIQASQLVSVVLALFVAVSITTGTITWQHLLIASFVQGTAMPLMMPARMAIIPQLVGRERLMNAVALNSMGMSLTTMVAPAIAGGLISAVGIGQTYYLMAAMNVGAILFTGLLPSVQSAGAGRQGNMLSALKGGLRYVASNSVLLVLLALGFSTMVLAMPIRFILPIFAKDVFLVGSGGLGAMMSLMGFGGLGGALIIAAMGKVGRRGSALAFTGIISGAVLLGFAVMSEYTPSFPAALVFMGAIGLIQAARMTLNASLMMENTEDEYRGRVMSLFTLNMALMPAGVLPVTIAADRVGAPVALGFMAVLLIAVAGVIFLSSGRLRRLA